ncbi:MAG: transcription termination factor NusA [Chloroflexi bacterium]|nr:MAG: transcription termination factor NusA [Chloroflexota bacterium]
MSTAGPRAGSAPGRVPTGGAALREALVALQRDLAIDEATVRRIVEGAVVDTYRRLVADDPEVQARVDLGAGSVGLFRDDGRGGSAPVEAPVADFARQAAQAAKAAVAGWAREAERERVIREGMAQKGELIDVLVERLDGALWWVRAGNLAALLPPEEQTPGEQLQRQQHLKVVVIDVRRRQRDAVVVVSRTHPSLLRRLLEQEVPELADGRVLVKAVAREAGRRSKVAVHAPEAGIDAQGACIGPRGVRIRAVVSELGEEQVQVVEWSADPAEYVASALAPAQVSAVELDNETRTAHAVVPDDQLSLAIGRSGENARLAARLTGWRIDISGESGHPRRETATSPAPEGEDAG